MIRYTLILLFILAVLVRLYDLSTESLWVDEVFTIRTAQLEPGELINAVSQDNHPPLYPLILHYWMQLSGDSTWSLRFPSVFFGIITIYLSYLLASKLADQQTAVFAIALIAVSYMHIQYAQEIRSYTLTLVFALASLYTFLLILERNSASRIAAYVSSTLLLIYTHYWGFAVLLCEVMYFIYLKFQNRKIHLRLSHYILILLTLLVLYLPWLKIFYLRLIDVKREFWVQSPDFFTIPKTFLVYAGTFTPFGIIALILILAVIVYGLIKTTQLIQNHSIIFLVVLSTFPILIPLFFSFIWTPVYIIRITIVASIFFYILTAYGINRIERSAIRYAVFAVLIVCSVANLNIYFTETNKERWNEAIAFVEQNAAPQDLIVFNLPFGREVHRLYAKRNDLELIALPEQGRNVSSKEMEGLLSRVRFNQDIWLILSHARDKKLIHRYLHQEMTVTKTLQLISYGINSHKPYIGIEIQCFSRIED